ncbi:MAG: vWA domain-containing protein [Pseudomonadota bacterium]
MRPSVVHRFAASSQGSIAILFGIMLPTVFLVFGACLDVSRWLSARTITREAINAAVLAGARHLQVSRADATAAADVARARYAAAVENRVGPIVDNIDFIVSNDGTSVATAGQAELKTVVMSVFGYDQVPLINADTTGRAQAVVKVAARANQSLEVALALDVSSSMQGELLDDLKQAAKDFVDIVTWQNGPYTSRVALVPFADAVQVEGQLFYQSIRNDFYAAATPILVYPLAAGTNTVWRLMPHCMSERIGAAAFTDAPPEDESTRYLGVFTPSSTCQPSGAAVEPLSDQKLTLHTAIDEMTAGGGTAKHVGLAWAWNMLSPRWASYLALNSQPQTYDGLNTYNANGEPVLRKVVVLVTDGDSNVEYCANGLRAMRFTEPFFSAACTAENGPSFEQSRQLCETMKDRGITIATVGLNLTDAPEAQATLNACATNAELQYTVNNGREMRQAFRGLALKLTHYGLQS